MRGVNTFVFVHGLSGWGSYDRIYRRMPYWGMRGGDLMAFLKGKGYRCFAASVSPTGSAWDRACELYAQISGTQVDYGVHHSEVFHHARFGRDFSDCPLIPDFGPDTRLVLLGHSFGGATVRLFAELMANGDPHEKTGGSFRQSPLFSGGMGDRIHSIVTLASPMNGTSVYDMFSDPAFDPEKVKVPVWSRPLTRMMSMGTEPRKDGRDEQDYADYDMYIDHAMQLNRRISMDPSVYYFSVPCSCSTKQEDGTYLPDREMEPMFIERASQIGAYSGRTKGGYEINEAWRENDGLVNTVSATYPFGCPAKAFDRSNVEPGIWNVFPVYKGDHMALQGGMLHKHDVRGFYLRLLRMICRL